MFVMREYEWARDKAADIWSRYVSDQDPKDFANCCDILVDGIVRHAIEIHREFSTFENCEETPQQVAWGIACELALAGYDVDPYTAETACWHAVRLLADDNVIEGRWTAQTIRAMVSMP